MKKLIIGNWKCNPTTIKEAKKLFGAVKKGIGNPPSANSGGGGKNAEVIICPPFVYLPLLKGLTLGAQNVFYKESGAFTGQISTLMLKDLKVEYVIIGHSEARKYLNETDQIINKKIKECLNAGLKPILCVGENSFPTNFESKLGGGGVNRQSTSKLVGDKGEDRDKILENQITQALKNVSLEDLKNIIIAYEPVWAIGTGKNCSVDQTINSILLIRKIISQLYNKESSDLVKILYGGSVNSQNASSYIKQAGTGGLLVGGASLDAKEFIKIVSATG